MENSTESQIDLLTNNWLLMLTFFYFKNWPHCQKTKRNTASDFLPNRNTKFCQKPAIKNVFIAFKIRVFQPFGRKRSLTQFFFSHLVLSFGIGIEPSFCYKVDTSLWVYIWFSTCQNLKPYKLFEFFSIFLQVRLQVLR